MGRKPRKLLERINLTYDLDDFDSLLKVLTGIRKKYSNKLIEMDTDLSGCKGHGPEEYCYCSSPSVNVCVYDVELIF